MTFAAAFMYAQAQEAETAAPVAQLDSLTANAEGEQVQVAYRKVNQNDLLGGVSFVNVEKLMEKNYIGSYSLTDMQSYVSGWNGSNLWGMDSYLVLVDGVPRDANNVLPSEIAQISFLKGAQAVVLYGSRAADGVIYITTKRGQAGKTRIDVRGNTGFHVPVSYPEYLGAAEYMTLYNEARLNDGLDPTYTDAQIYHTANKTNPFRYPDVNLYSDEYLKKAYNESDVTAEISGGSERARFYTNINFYNIGSLVKFGEADNDHTTRFSVRGNIDVDLGEYVQAYADANATFYDGQGARGNFWTAAGSLRPNRITPLIPIDMLMPNDKTAWDYVNSSMYLIDGKYLLGGTSLDQTNELANLLVAGTNTYTSRQYQFDLGVNVDLSMVLKGLSFKTMYAIDYATTYNHYYGNSYATYEPQWGNVNGKDVIIGLTQYGQDTHDGTQHVADSYDRQTMTFSAQFDYQNRFGDNHNVAASLIAAGWQRGETAVYHKTSNVNLGLQLDYNYQNKYYASFGGALVHSARLPKNNRNAFSPSVSLGWRISREDFFRDNVSWIDDLKLTASYANLHQDLDIEKYYMYEGYFSKTDGMYPQWHDGTAGGWTPTSKQGTNLDLDFITRQEFRVGIDATLFDRFLRLNANYFHQDTKGLLTQGSSTMFPSFFQGSTNNTFLPWINYNEDRRSGFDFSLSANKKIGEVDVTLGFSGMYFTSQAMVRDEMYDEAYQERAGRPLDVSFGYICDGFFNSQEEIDNHARQTFGTVRPGDLKYRDINGDNVIDSKDQVELGKNGWAAPPFSFGLNLTLKYKDFTFFAMGTGQTGSVDFKSSSYYWNRGTSKFSEVVWGRWTEETKETATYPRLTTTNGDNNYQTSTFWMYKRNYFNLNQVQLTYDFPEDTFKGTFVRDLSVYCGGSSLLTISKERKHMELSTGVPNCRNFYLGFKAAF